MSGRCKNSQPFLPATLAAWSKMPGEGMRGRQTLVDLVDAFMSTPIILYTLQGEEL
jgi:hypothetical protein